jgi:hypothetical protein
MRAVQSNEGVSSLDSSALCWLSAGSYLRTQAGYVYSMDEVH